MPIPVIPVAAAGTAVLGAGALVVALVLPPSAYPQSRVWMDQPTTGTLLIAGDIVLTMHGTGAHSVSQLRIDVENSDGSLLTTLNDTTPDASKVGGGEGVLSYGEVVWRDAVAGSFVLVPAALSDGQWSEGSPTPVVVAAGLGPEVEPTSAPQPDPENTPAPEETPEPDPDPEPDDPAPDDPSPEPSSDDPDPPSPGPSTPSTPAPVGTLERIGGDYTEDSDFIVRFSPSGATVDVQLQIVPAGTAMKQSGSWASYGCTMSSTNCRLHTYTPGNAQARWAYYRAVITANGKSTIVYGSGYWSIPQVVG